MNATRLTLSRPIGASTKEALVPLALPLVLREKTKNKKSPQYSSGSGKVNTVWNERCSFHVLALISKVRGAGKRLVSICGKWQQQVHMDGDKSPGELPGSPHV